MGNRDLDAAWAYHDGTKHSFESIRSEPHFLDWDNMPSPFKVYPGLEPIALPRELEGSRMPVLDALADPGTYGGRKIDLGLLAYLLYFSAGVLRRRRHQLGDSFFRAAACTGNLHHIDAYLVCRDLPELGAGVYHFAPHDFSLNRLREGDHRAFLQRATAHEPSVVDAEAVIVFASTYWRNSWKYRSRAYRHCFWDAGTLLANLLALAASRDVSARLVMGFVDESLRQLLDLDANREGAIALVALGRGAGDVPGDSPSVNPLALDTLPLSSREVDYPAIRAMHAASALATEQEVAEWRVPLDSSRPSFQGPETQLVSQPSPAEPVQSVIKRRGSARGFAHGPIELEKLASILRAATRGVPADFLAPGAQRAVPHLVVNAVEGLAPGAYVYDREREALRLIREGSFRREAGGLALGQALGADAAVDIYWLTDLHPMLERLGNRGYRAAQLEAAIGGGKTYLAAYALGFGATGLTFFDDDVIRFFSPAAERSSVMFLMALGHPG